MTLAYGTFKKTKHPLSLRQPHSVFAEFQLVLAHQAAEKAEDKLLKRNSDNDCSTDFEKSGATRNSCLSLLNCATIWCHGKLLKWPGKSLNKSWKKSGISLALSLARTCLSKTLFFFFVVSSSSSAAFKFCYL